MFSWWRDGLAGVGRGVGNPLATHHIIDASIAHAEDVVDAGIDSCVGIQ